tara:strand:+ start:354 stop:2240 length:1887 start_codon:yes stop_codon:yes gene_type:complete
MDDYDLSKIQQLSNINKSRYGVKNTTTVNINLLSIKPIIKKENKIKYNKPSELRISTYTMTSNLNDTIDLFILSRLLPIYNENNLKTENKKGCFISISDYTEELNTDLPRGHVNEAIKLHVFNNQISLYFKYWGFKNINVKIFTNGKLQLTGVKDPWEAQYMSERLKNKLENLYCMVYSNKKKLSTIYNVDFACVWNKKLEKVEFYRKKINSYDIKNILNYGMIYSFDTNNIKDNKKFIWQNQDNIKKSFESFKNDSKKEIDTLNKILNKILNLYEFNYEQKDNIVNTLNMRYSKIIKINKKKIIHDDDKFKKVITSSINKLIKTFKNYNLKLDKCYETDLRFVQIIDIIFKKIINYQSSDNNENTDAINKNSESDEINKNTDKFNKDEKNDEKNNEKNDEKNNEKNNEKNDEKNDEKIEKENIFEIIINKINDTDFSKYNIIYDNDTDIKINMQDILKKKYIINNITTELINSDFNTNFNINLSQVSNILKNDYAIYNYYQPNNKYPGVIIKFYYNENYLDDTIYNLGVCNCPNHCAEKDTKTCTIISISVFRPGSIIITAAKSIKQLVFAYNFINNFLKDNFNEIIYKHDYDNTKQYKINQQRKICRKSQLYYINKKNIINKPDDL